MVAEGKAPGWGTRLPDGRDVRETLGELRLNGASRMLEEGWVEGRERAGGG